MRLTCGRAKAKLSPLLSVAAATCVAGSAPETINARGGDTSRADTTSGNANPGETRTKQARKRRETWSGCPQGHPASHSNVTCNGSGFESPCGARSVITEHGGVREWTKRAVLKTVTPVRVSRVQIPVPPPIKECKPLWCIGEHRRFSVVRAGFNSR